MSGIEIVLLVGVGILVAKKVKDHRAEKKQKQLAEAGLLPQQHGPAQLVTSETQQQQQQQQQQHQHQQHQHQQQVPGEDESLPLYTPPPAGEIIANGDQKVHLPSYDETIERDTRHRESESESNEINLNNEQPAQGTVNGTSLEASTTPTEGKTRPKKWKLWRKDQAPPR